METLLAAAEPDFGRVDKLEEQLDWDQVIYTDRQRSITYLCETPTLLERRLFSIAQMLQQVVQGSGLEGVHRLTRYCHSSSVKATVALRGL